MNSIFKTRGPLDPGADAAITVDRPELEQLLRATQAPVVDAYYAVLSARQTGKTTLLYQLRARLRAAGYGAALLDLAAVRELPEPEFYRFVASQIHAELEPILPRKLKRANAEDLPTNAIEFRQRLFDIARQVQSPRLVILIDEVEGVPEAYADGFFGTIRNVFSSRRKEDEAAFEKYLFVFSGARELHRLTTGPNSPLNIAERIYLQDLALDGVQKLVSNFARANIPAPVDTAAWIFEQTHGHPYLTQKLCATIEQTRPNPLARETVHRATQQILHSDDHLEKMLLQIDGEPTARDLLRQILSRQSVRFSRLQPAVARLELLGAIRDEGHCVVRNAIYETALRAHLTVPAAERAGIGGWFKQNWRRLLMIVAAVLLITNLPVLYIYTTDILLAPKTVNERFQFTDPDLRGVIHYNRVLKPGQENATTIGVEAETINTRIPVSVTFRKIDADIVISGGALQRQFPPPSHVEEFKFWLTTGPLPYNPFDPFTAHRKIDLVFESPTGGPSQSLTLDYRVDFYSAFLVSIGLVLTGLGSALASVWRGVRYARAIIAPNSREARKLESEER